MEYTGGKKYPPDYNPENIGKINGGFVIHGLWKNNQHEKKTDEEVKSLKTEIYNFFNPVKKKCNQHFLILRKGIIMIHFGFRISLHLEI